MASQVTKRGLEEEPDPEDFMGRGDDAAEWSVGAGDMMPKNETNHSARVGGECANLVSGPETGGSVLAESGFVRVRDGGTSKVARDGCERFVNMLASFVKMTGG